MNEHKKHHRKPLGFLYAQHLPPAVRLLFLALAAWVNRQQQDVIDYLLEENRILREQIGGITPSPNGQWMKQIGRNLTDHFDGFLRDARYLILDRDPLYTLEFREFLGASGCEVVRLPARSPNLNAYAERFVLSVKSECLNKIIPLSESHLRHVLREYAAHYHEERPHQGLGNRLLNEVPPLSPEDGPIKFRERLGGMLKHYYREAA